MRLEESKEIWRGLSHEERLALRSSRELARAFIDDEAEESDGEGDSDLVAEDGFHSYCRGMRPLDSKGMPFIRFIGTKNRLVKVLSREFFELDDFEKKEIIRQEKLHNDIVKLAN